MIVVLKVKNPRQKNKFAPSKLTGGGHDYCQPYIFGYCLREF
ncbi:hypothetical protein NSP_37630 [Nodularia spumigena CCY9414]|nr:hypothetical protein NSP_37630 [Nodularia spumigena CCY9414]